MKRFFDSLLASAGLVFGFMFGEANGLFYALISFVVLDYITGVIKAIMSHTLTSAASFRGICRKIMLFIIVAVANIIDVQILGVGSSLKTAVIFLFIANEGISLLENAQSMGVPIPEKLLQVLAQLKLRAKSHSAKERENGEGEEEIDEGGG